MKSIVLWLGLRFLRLWLWVPAFIVPLLVYAAVLLGRDGSVELANKVMLDMLVFGLPLLAAITVLTAVDRSRLGTILIRPIRPPWLLASIWIGGLLPYLVCYAGLTAIAVVATSTVRSIGSEPPPEGLDYYPDVKILRGLPSSPARPPGPTHRERAPWLARDDPWTFEVHGITAGVADLEACLVAYVGRLFTPTAEGEPKLLRIGAADARVRFVDDDGEDLVTPKHVLLKNRARVSFDIPRAAVMEDGRLRAVVAWEASVDEQHDAGDDQGDPGHEDPGHEDPSHEDPGHEDHGHEDHEGHDHEGVSVRVVWFDRFPTPERVGADGFYSLSLDARGLPESGLFVVRARHSMESSFLRLSLLGAGLLLFVGAMATFATAVFGPAVAFALSATIFVCGISMSFLREIVEGLKTQSASIIFRDPLEPAAAHAPGLLDRSLEKVLSFWVNVLPDFQLYHGGDLFVVGDVARWSVLGDAYALCLCYLVAFFGVSLFVLNRWEIER